MPDDLLHRALYSYPEVDRLAGLSAGTAHRWLEGYRLRGQSYPPVLRPDATGSTAVTWGELVEVWLLAEFRHAVPVRWLRSAVVRLRAEFGPGPLARAHPLLEVDGRELVRIIEDQDGPDRPAELIVVRSGQHALPDGAHRFRTAVVRENGIVVRLRPDPSTPAVLIDPRRAFGRPAIRDAPTAALAEEVRSGAGPAELAERYDLTIDEVEQAVRYEATSDRRRDLHRVRPPLGLARSPA
ncbi:DUF433 domain-containing protein [Microlunatus speluncae]|uniref:DUF433 domain-containing protein n=1 Tax=Microlunatus speluncae TaxID=2594267 RepID=UPI00126654C1|nr:DUF433 domain-containing protein [Microlunatus speluncae]